MAKRRKEPIVVLAVFLAVEVGLLALLGYQYARAYRNRESAVENEHPFIEPKHLYVMGGGLAVMYLAYVQLRARRLKEHIVGEKVKTQTVLEALPNGVLVVDDAGTIVTANSAACRLLAADPILCLGQPASAYFDETTALKVGEGFTGSTEGRSREANRRLRVSVTALRGEAGRMVLVEDVGDAAAAAPAAAPIPAASPVATWTDRLWKKLAPVADAEGLPADVRTAVSDALLIAARSRGAILGDDVPSPPRRSRTALAAALEGAMRRAGAVAKARGIALKAEVSDLAEASLDASWFERAVEELLLNALAFTKAGGEIQVKAGVEGGQVVVVVRDNGLGIPADDLPRVTDPGYVGSRQTPASEGGRGQGLHVARKVAEAHGGSVRVESREGVGTRVTYTQPA